MVYIDDYWTPVGTAMCHMIADTEAELEAMARKLDLKPEWRLLGGRYRIPHYVVPIAQRLKAISFGARLITCRQLMTKGRRRHDTQKNL